MKILAGPFLLFKNHKTLFILTLILVIFSTVITQVGGLIVWLFIAPAIAVARKVGAYKTLIGSSVVIAGYLLTAIVIIPPLASISGRTTLPWASSDELLLSPRSWIFNLSMRNYVKSELLEMLTDVSQKYSAKYPGYEIQYLDASFPFFDGIPLLPHFSHHDGKKIDLALIYKDENSKQVKSPSFFGYWIYAQPQKNERQPCANQKSPLRWDFDLLQSRHDSILLDEEKTAYLAKLLVAHTQTHKLFIEPHLKDRLHLNNSKVRFQGCRAARHDDHIHVQVK